MSSPPKTGPVTAATAAELLERLYGLTGAVEALPGERDRNFRITAPTGSFVLKVHGAYADPRVLDLQNRALEHIARSDRSLPVQRVVPSRNGDETPRVCVDDGSHRWARLLTWIPGTVWAEAGPYEPSLVASLGTFVARVDRALADFEHPAMQRPYRWGMQFAAECRELLPLIDDGVRRAMAADLLARFAHDIGPRLAACRAQVIHNDASERNILVGPERTVVGLIDFGDLMYSPTVCGVAVGCAYAMLGSELPVEGILPLVAAYDEVIRLTDTELELLFDLVETRLAMSMCMAAWQSQRAPENEYLLVSQQSVWELLQRLRGENRHLAHFRFRDVCGREPNPSSRAIVNWMEVHSDVFAGVTRHDLATVPRLTFDFTAGSEEAARLEVLPDVAAITRERRGDRHRPIPRESGVVSGTAVRCPEVERAAHGASGCRSLSTGW
jgi:Ser/Thr protein kinase RdoA (MazF antagonist)